MKVSNPGKEEWFLLGEDTAQVPCRVVLASAGGLVWMPKQESSAEAAQSRAKNYSKVFPINIEAVSWQGEVCGVFW